MQLTSKSSTLHTRVFVCIIEVNHFHGYNLVSVHNTFLCCFYVQLKICTEVVLPFSAPSVEIKHPLHSFGAKHISN